MSKITTVAYNKMAEIVAEAALLALADNDYPGLSASEVVLKEIGRANNANGFTIEFSGSMGSTVRHESIYLQPEDVTEVANRALAII